MKRPCREDGRPPAAGTAETVGTVGTAETVGAVGTGAHGANTSRISS